MSYLGHINNLKDNEKYYFYSFFADDWNSNHLIIEPYKDFFNNYEPFLQRFKILYFYLF